MKMSDYQKQSSRTANTHRGPRTDHLANFALGLTGESGEVADHIKKYIFHGHPLHKAELEKELGDVLWYVSQLVDVLELDLDVVAQKNIDKLRRRYPDGFSEEDSLNRKDVQG